MLVTNKIAVIYGAGGAIGGAVARAFAREGAMVFLTGRNLDAVDAVAKDIIAAGGTAKAAQVDALDEHSVEEHISAVIKKAGSVRAPRICSPGGRYLPKPCGATRHSFIARICSHHSCLLYLPTFPVKLHVCSSKSCRQHEQEVV